MEKKKKWKKPFICFVGLALIWVAVSLKSSPLGEKGEISWENFVYCHIQTMEVIDDTGYGRAVKIRDLEQAENLMETIGELEVRSSLPWEKIHKEVAYPYTIEFRYDSEDVGRYEIIRFWKNGKVFFRDQSYMIVGRNKAQMTDRLEWMLQNYDSEE